MKINYKDPYIILSLPLASLLIYILLLIAAAIPTMGMSTILIFIFHHGNIWFSYLFIGYSLFYLVAASFLFIRHKISAHKIPLKRIIISLLLVFAHPYSYLSLDYINQYDVLSEIYTATDKVVIQLKEVKPSDGQREAKYKWHDSENNLSIILTITGLLPIKDTTYSFESSLINKITRNRIGQCTPFSITRWNYLGVKNVPYYWSFSGSNPASIRSSFIQDHLDQKAITDANLQVEILCNLDSTTLGLEKAIEIKSDYRRRDSSSDLMFIPRNQRVFIIPL